MFVANTDLHNLNAFLTVSVCEYGYERNEHNFSLTFEQALAIGITTVDEAEHHSFLSLCYYEGYKDVHGCKARWVDYRRTTIAQLESMLAHLDAEYEIQRQYEVEEELRAQERMEANIASIIESGAGDRETALRWMAQAENFYHGQCLEGFIYDAGVLFTEYGRTLQKEMGDICVRYGLYRFMQEEQEAA